MQLFTAYTDIFQMLMNSISSNHL